MHPADLDGALQSSSLLARAGVGGETRLPFAVDAARLRGPAAGWLWAAAAGLMLVPAWLSHDVWFFLHHSWADVLALLRFRHEHRLPRAPTLLLRSNARSERRPCWRGG